MNERYAWHTPTARLEIASYSEESNKMVLMMTADISTIPHLQCCHYKSSCTEGVMSGRGIKSSRATASEMGEWKSLCCIFLPFSFFGKVHQISIILWVGYGKAAWRSFYLVSIQLIWPTWSPRLNHLQLRVGVYGSNLQEVESHLHLSKKFGREILEQTSNIKLEQQTSYHIQQFIKSDLQKKI